MINIKGSNVTIMVKDMDEAISFYENIGLSIKNAGIIITLWYKRKELLLEFILPVQLN